MGRKSEKRGEVEMAETSPYHGVSAGDPALFRSSTISFNSLVSVSVSIMELPVASDGARLLPASCRIPELTK